MRTKGEPFSAVILTGGFGTRMGRDKASAPIAGRPLLHWMAETLAPLTDDLLVVRRAEQRLPAPPPGVHWREAVDGREARGPLAGIEAALTTMRHELAFIAACDMPLLQSDLVEAVVARADGVDVVLPVLADFDQPLFAAYRRTCLPTVVATLDAGVGKIGAIYATLRVCRVPEADLRRVDATLESFTNVNAAADLDRVAARLASRARGGRIMMAEQDSPLYRRVFSAQVAPGKHREFLAAIESALDYQQQRGIQASTRIWGALTGSPNLVEIVSVFDSLNELEQFEELVAQDQTFAELRQRVAKVFVAESASVTLYRHLG